MKMFVLLDPLAEGGYNATLLGWPEVTAQGTTEEEALNNVRLAVRVRLAQAKIVPIELEEVPADHPWLRLAGMFQDNPLVDEVEAEIASYRCEVDTREDTSS